MLLALKVKQEIEIKNAFVAFADDILYQRVKPTYDALSYFLAEEEGQFNTKKEALRFIKKLNNNGIESNLIKIIVQRYQRVNIKKTGELTLKS